jgi:hypothetical protein
MIYDAFTGTAYRTHFDNGEYRLYPLMDPPVYNDRQFLDEGDFSRTVHAMGHNIVEWTTDIFHRGFVCR